MGGGIIMTHNLEMIYGNQCKPEIEKDLVYGVTLTDYKGLAGTANCKPDKEETNQTQLKKEDERFQDIEGATTCKSPLTKSKEE